jgi:hypothetical protein
LRLKGWPDSAGIRIQADRLERTISRIRAAAS